MGIRSRLIRLLRPEPAAPPPDTGLDDRVEQLEARADKLEKRLSMAMGAVQAATAQLMDLKEDTAQVGNAARQAMQKATSASSTAEAAVDGLTGVEEQVARLIEGLGTRSPRAPSKPRSKSKSKSKSKPKPTP